MERLSQKYQKRMVQNALIACNAYEFGCPLKPSQTSTNKLFVQVCFTSLLHPRAFLKLNALLFTNGTALNIYL